ncbi:MAG: ABC transporter ATP-binding protein [Candidatus Lokiarchaeota archaeon]|nr:ABC transporter ATP-binding protein [Candidatus Lokiarchaeota archaeon]
MSKNETNEEEEKEIIQPGMGMKRHMMMGGDNSKLEHPRRELWKWLFSYLRDYRRKFLTFLILLILGTLISSINPVISKNILDYGIVAKDRVYIINMSTLYFSLLLFMAFITYFSTYGMGKMSQKITFEIRNDLFYKLQDMSLGYFDRRSSGDIMSITTNDVTQLNMLVGGQFVYIISSVVGLILNIFIMFFLNTYLALLSLSIFPVFFFFSYLFRKVAMGLFKESRKTIGKVTSSIQENIAGAKVVQAYGQEKRASTEFDEANTANYNAMLKIRKFMATIFPLIGLVTTVITASILLAGGFMVLGNVSVFGILVSVGTLTAFVSILSQFFKPFMMLMGIQEIIASALAASDRIYSLLNEKVEILETNDPVKLETIAGEINFNLVSFGYTLENGEKTILESMPVHGEPKVLRPIEMSRPLGISDNPMMQQMMKRAMEFIKALPEPYSAFMMKNAMLMPQNIRQKHFMRLMNQNPSKAPSIIDDILSEFNYAVPGTDIANNHPEFQTSFKRVGEKSLKEDSSLVPELPPEAILQMTKFLAKGLQTKATIQSSSGGIGEGGGMMGGGMPKMDPKTMLKMLASINIEKEIYDQIPKVVRDAIEEKKKISQHEQSKGFVLKKVNLDIPPGKTMAIVGETGSGKTTITKLISRFYDVNDGEILLDNVNIREITKNDLRNLIGLVPQDAFLFTGTIKENLLYAFENPTKEVEDKMIEVSKFLGLHNFIEALHKKYDTILKENASNISIGQRQLIAFARALITDPKILILDEATSSVDPYTETLIQDALDKARKGRTTIIIAHRLSTIKNADHIIVLSADKKGIIEQGTHESLLELNGKYKRLLEMQHRDIDIEIKD